MKQDKQSFCVTIFRKNKEKPLSIIFYMMYLIKVNISLAVVLCDYLRREKDVTQPITAQKVKFSIKDFFSKCYQIRRNT